MPSFTSHVFKDKELSDISTRIDDLIGNIPLPDEESPVEDITGKFIDQVLLKDDSKSKKGVFGETLEQDKLFDDISVPAERLARYAVYKEINRSVPIIKRIVKVYTSHLLQKNPVDGKCIIYREASKVSQEDDDKVKNARVFAEKIETHFDLPGKLKNSICPKKLLYGNCFVEVVDVRKESEKIDLTKVSMITEVQSLEEQIKSINGHTSVSSTQIGLFITRVADILHEVFDGKDSTSVERVSTTPGKVSEEKQDEIAAKETEKDILNPFLDIVLKIHEPHNIIILQSKYGTRLGYLEVHSDPSMEYQSVAQNISNVVGKITTLNKSSVPEQTIIDKIIEKILKKTLLKSSDFDSSKIDSALKSLGEDVYIFIKRLFIEQDLGNKSKFKKIKTRFIPISRMVDFSVPSSDYAPYGESIVDPLILPCKLYMLAQLSNVIIKLSRAAVVRKWVNNIAPYWSNPIKKIALIQGNS
jgi:hypothetical protein